jgi:hypothetical protein
LVAGHGASSRWEASSKVQYIVVNLIDFKRYKN